MAVKKIQKKTRKKKITAGYTYLGCPLTHNRTPWCFRLCKPSAEGRGYCGRVAPHSLSGNIRSSIAKFKKNKDSAHCKKLEAMYEAAPNSVLFKASARVSMGYAEVEVTIPEHFQNPLGVTHSAAFYKAMEDASWLAANSVVNDTVLLGVHFNTVVSHPVTNGRLTAKAKCLGEIEDRFQSEVVLTDEDNHEVARGQGAFMKSGAPLSPELGYCIHF